MEEVINYGFLSVLPPIVTIALALVTKNVFISLFIGVFMGYSIISDFNIITSLNETLLSFVRVFESSSNTIIIMVTMLLGALIYMIEQSGGVNGFVEFMTKKKGIIKSKKGANIFTWLMGLLVFTSGTLSTLVVGSVTRPLNDSLKVPREKAAFIVHTTSTPVCVLIPLSGWGASMMGYLQSAGIEGADATQVLLQSIPLNFYCILAVLSVLFFALTGKDFGPMKKVEESSSSLVYEDITETKFNEGERVSTPMNLLIPMVIMIGSIFTVLMITGKGNFTNGDGMLAILWGTFIGIVVAGIMYRSQNIFKVGEMVDIAFKGASSMLSIASILMFAFAMGSVVKQLGTGQYLANTMSAFLIPSLLPAVIFIIAAIISFATGTSMGTMAIVMVIAIPMAVTMGSNIPLVASAVFGGSIFGDHSSPISDTCIMSCSSTGCDIMSHVKTQMPYTLFFAAMTIAFYIVAGFVM